MVPLALVANLATSWHHLYKLHIWPPTWTGLTFGHQVAPLALFAKLATRLRNLRCHIALDCPIANRAYWHYQLVLGWYHHQPESTQLSLTKVSEFVTSGPLDRTPGLPGSDKKVAQGESGPKG